MDASIVFLSTDQVLRLHQIQIERFGGLPGVREPGLLDSALAQPGVSFGEQYLHSDVFEMAAAYLYHICMNHPFADGNKRTALHASYVFLKLNGWQLEMGDDALYELVVAVAEGRADKAAVADAFRAHSVQLGGDE